MKNCLLKKTEIVSESIIIPIIQEQYEEITKKKEPYVQKRSNTIKNYAYCPCCENPVQIIGMYKRKEINSLDNEKQPFARHTGKKIVEIEEPIIA